MMSQSGDRTGQSDAAEAFAPFAIGLSCAASRQHAFALLAEFARAIGFDDLCLTIDNTGPSGQARCARWSTLASDRLARLDAIGFDGHDPVRRFAKRTSDPIVWSCGAWPGDQGPVARDIMAKLPEASVEAGMSLALWGRAGRIAMTDAFGPEARVRGLRPDMADAFFLAAAQAVRVIDRLSVTRSMPALTWREIEILELAAQGFSARSIASRLRIVEPTVKFHFKGIREKLNVRSRAEAIASFARLGPALTASAGKMQSI